jgi:O-antigen biosynthesis protein
MQSIQHSTQRQLSACRVSQDNRDWNLVYLRYKIRLVTYLEERHARASYTRTCAKDPSYAIPPLNPASTGRQPSFSIVILGSGFAKTLQSIESQAYSLEKVVVMRPVGKEIDLKAISSDFVVFIPAGDQLQASFLQHCANRIAQADDIDLVYADSDEITSSGKRRRPFFKPDWSPDYLETFNYIGTAACFRTSVVQQCEKYSNAYDFILRFTERARRIEHVRGILYHANVSRSKKTNLEKERVALSDRLSRQQRGGNVLRVAGTRHFYIEPAEVNNDLVSIVIPTKGKTVLIAKENLLLVRNLVASIKCNTTHPNYEIVIVHNGDLDGELIGYLKNEGCRLVHYDSSEINIAKKINLGVASAKGEYLVLMNDDLEILTPRWLERLQAHFSKKHVGVVGCKLIYDTFLIQHCGMISGRIYWDHPRRNCLYNDAGYFYSASGVRNYMSVTGALTMTTKQAFNKVGGWSEEFPLEYNDVDYCLKLRRAGLTTVCDPFVTMFHFESKSRPTAKPPEHSRLFAEKWPDFRYDPYHNKEFLTDKLMPDAPNEPFWMRIGRRQFRQQLFKKLTGR